MLNYLHDFSSIVRAPDQRFSLSIKGKYGKILYVNDRFCALSKYTREEILDQKHSLFDSGMYPDDYFDEMWRMLNLGQVWQRELHNRAKDGSL